MSQPRQQVHHFDLHDLLCQHWSDLEGAIDLMGVRGKSTALFRQFTDRTVRALIALYYALLYGRRFPLSRRVGRITRSWERRHDLGNIPTPQQDWDTQYAGGHWDYMGRLEELSRYSIPAGYIKHLKPGGSLLDVGCGEGLLLTQLSPDSYSRYVGIDISAVAIEKARRRSNGKTRFICCPAQDYRPEESFDAIIFNESLYYLEDPLELMEQYGHHLNEEGLFITGLYLNSHRVTSIWRRVKSTFRPLDEVTATHRSRHWAFNVLGLR